MNAEDQNEQAVMQQFLSAHPCGCDATRVLTGIVFYTDPLRYEWRCLCGRAGDVGYASRRSKEIEVKVTAEPV